MALVPYSASPASLEEIRSSLLRFKENDKFVVAYADTYTQGTYQLASLADEIYLNIKAFLDGQKRNRVDCQ